MENYHIKKILKNWLMKVKIMNVRNVIGLKIIVYVMVGVMKVINIVDTTHYFSSHFVLYNKAHWQSKRAD